jgi:hypothetical protein
MMSARIRRYAVSPTVSVDGVLMSKGNLLVLLGVIIARSTPGFNAWSDDAPLHGAARCPGEPAACMAARQPNTMAGPIMVPGPG